MDWECCRASVNACQWPNQGKTCALGMCIPWLVGFTHFICSYKSIKKMSVFNPYTYLVCLSFNRYTSNADPRFLCYLPSVIAAATITLVIEEVDPCNALEYQNQLMCILKISKVRISFTRALIFLTYMLPFNSWLWIITGKTRCLL